MASSSVDLPPVPLSGSHDMSPEDLQTVRELFQKCPQLWADFRSIIDFLDLLTENPQAYKQLFQQLYKMITYIEGHCSSEDRIDFIHFAVAVGFVKRSVDFSRHIMREMGKTYNTEFPPFSCESTAFDVRCLYLLRSHILNSTGISSLFRLRLAQTGFFEDLVEDIKHIKHLSGEALVQGKVFLLSLGTINNCCFHPDVIPLVKQMNIVNHITPFLDKRSKRQMVKSLALRTLSHIVDESQLDLVRLDEMLQVFLDNVQGALAAGETSHGNSTTSGMLHDLAFLARNDFNKRLMVAQGAVDTVVSVLGSSHKRPVEEKRNAVTLISRLVTDPTNRRVCQRDGRLAKVLKALTNSSGPIEDEVKNLLTLLDQRDVESECTPTSPHLADVLADQLNVLTIMDVGHVELVLDQLTSLITEGDSSFGDVSRHKLLQALTELAGDDDCRREIMARGGLGAVKKVLQTGQTAEQTQAAKVVLELVSCEENRVTVKNDATLMDLLRDSTGPDLRQVAENVLRALDP